MQIISIPSATAARKDCDMYEDMSSDDSELWDELKDDFFSSQDYTLTEEIHNQPPPLPPRMYHIEKKPDMPDCSVPLVPLRSGNTTNSQESVQNRKDSYLSVVFSEPKQKSKFNANV